MHVHNKQEVGPLFFIGGEWIVVDLIQTKTQSLLHSAKHQPTKIRGIYSALEETDH